MVILLICSLKLESITQSLVTTLIELASQIKPMSDLQQPLFVKIKQDLTDMNRYRENYREA